MNRFGVAVLLAILLGHVDADAGTIIYPIDQESTAGFSNGEYVGESARGWDFVIDRPITVWQLGVNAGVTMDIRMTLWNVTTQTMLAQTTVTSQPYGWEFATLASGVSLAPGQAFSVIGWANTTEIAPWYIFDNDPPAAFNPTGTVTYLDTRFGNGIGPDQFPTSTVAPPTQYGVADIGYTTVPEPAAVVLVGAGLGLLGVLRRRREG